MLLDEIVQMKKEKELMERDGGRKENQVLHAREEMDKSASALRNAETKIQMLHKKARTYTRERTEHSVPGSSRSHRSRLLRMVIARQPKALSDS